MEKIHVLLVEDERTLSMIIKDTLEEQGFRISTAKNQNGGQDKGGDRPQNQHNFFKVDLCGHNHHTSIPPKSSIGATAYGCPGRDRTEELWNDWINFCATAA